MSERVYITLERDWSDYAQEIGVFTLAYLELRLKACPFCKYLKENGTAYIFLVCDDRDQAKNIYDVLAPNVRAGIFAEIKIKTSYRMDGRTIATTNDQLWHNRYYRTARSLLAYSMDKASGYRGPYNCELTRVLEPIKYKAS